MSFAKLWITHKLPVVVGTVRHTVAVVQETWERALNRTVELRSPYAAAPNGILASPLSIAGLIAAFVATTVLIRAAVTLYGRLNHVGPLRAVHHILGAVAHTALFALAASHAVYYGLPLPLISDPSAAPVALQASPLLATAFHLFMLLRIAECADTWLAIAEGKLRAHSPALIAARSIDIFLAWLFALYAPGGPAVWLLVVAAAEAATIHAVFAFAAGAFGPVHAAAHIHRYTTLVAGVLSLVQATVAGWLQPESPVCPHAILRVAALRAFATIIATTWHIYVCTKTPAVKRD